MFEEEVRLFVFEEGDELVIERRKRRGEEYWDGVKYDGVGDLS